MRIKNNRLVKDDGRMVDFVASPCNSGPFVDRNSKPTCLVIHYTAGGPASNTVNFFKNRNAQASAHFVIDRDGTITQMVKLNDISWHAGKSEWRGQARVNNFSIGIEIANYGKLSQTADGGWASWSGQSVANERVVLEEHKHFPGKVHGWEMFDEAQLHATVAAAKAIVEEFDLNPWDVVGHEDISMHRKVDPGPAFDIDRFRTLVFGRDEDSWNDQLFEVRSATGLNMRTKAEFDSRKIENLPDGTKVHLIEKVGRWWLVAKIVDGQDDVTGYVHSNWLIPSV